ncbi:MAG: hypothetical protein R3Y56_09900 [Akkermansia sp.]
MKKKTIIITVLLSLYVLLLVFSYRYTYASFICLDLKVRPCDLMEEPQQAREYYTLEDCHLEDMEELIALNEMFNITRHESNLGQDLLIHLMQSYDTVAQKEGASVARYFQILYGKNEKLSMVTRSIAQSSCLVECFKPYYHEATDRLYLVTAVGSSERNPSDPRPKGAVISYENREGTVRQREIFVYDLPEHLEYFFDRDEEEEEED